MSNETKTAHSVTIYGREFTVGVGTAIMPDSWRRSECLKPSRWNGAEFYLPSASYPDIELAVHIRITGRTLQRYQGEYWVRVAIEFVHEGEPNVQHTGRMLCKL